MPYAPIDVDLMRNRLRTVDSVKQVLSTTEGLQEIDFDTTGETSTVTFDLPNSWAVGLEDADDLTPTDATIRIDSTEYPLTKGAILKAASEVGLQSNLMLNTPGSLLTPVLNHKYSHGANGKPNMKMLKGPERGVGFVRASVSPFSNIRLLDAAIEGIQSKYGTDDILVDYKFSHDLDKTKVRLVVPSHSRAVSSARAESGVDDPWSVGLELSNSLLGKTPLQLSGYMFAWWCTNGSTINHVASGKYRRKPTLSPDNAYEWARNVVDDVLGDLEYEFASLDALTKMPLEGNLIETVTSMFDRFKVPANAREEILQNLAESDDLSAYGLMNAVTAAANNHELSSSVVDALLNAGGKMSHVLADACQVCHRF